MNGHYVDIEPRSIREAEERAEADACSCVVRGPIVVGSRRHEAFWAYVAAKAAAGVKVRRFQRRGEA